MTVDIEPEWNQYERCVTSQGGKTTRRACQSSRGRPKTHLLLAQPEQFDVR